jgi:hypothetical protein
VVRREQTYWKPEALASPVAVVITKSLQTKPQLPPILVLVLFVLSHLLSGLSCPCSASAAAVQRKMRMTRMVRTDVIAKTVSEPGHARQLTKWGKRLKLDRGPMPHSVNESQVLLLGVAE